MYEYIPEVMTFKECKELLKVGKNIIYLNDNKEL